jgi:hypothetical protein
MSMMSECQMISLKKGYEQFRGTSSVEERHSIGWPRRSDVDVDSVRQAFIRSPEKSISQASAELQMPLTIVQQST